MPNRGGASARRPKHANTRTPRSITTAPPEAPRAKSYRHPDAKAALPPDIGVQPQFRKRKPPKTYRYDSSLSPALDWDGQNPAREQGEKLIANILDLDTSAIERAIADLVAPGLSLAERMALGEVAKAAALKAIGAGKDAARTLKSLGQPFLNWAGKAERLSFDVPTLPLFVHERLSTQAIVKTLETHRKKEESGPQQLGMFELFADPKRPIADQILKPYEHGQWANRMILGDSLVVMNSLLEYEGLGGQVQMIYIDPPYGVKFGSNFQPFVRRRDVKDNDDESMTREPEMVKAYRDTWEIGLHSYLTYLRDRLMLARELLHPSGSVFVQISDENLHHVRELMDEVFGLENFCALISFQKTSSSSGNRLSSVADFIIWYARDITRTKYRQLYLPKEAGEEGGSQYTWAQLPDGTRKNFGSAENLRNAPEGSRVFVHDNITSQRPAQEGDVSSFRFEGKAFYPGKGTFKTDLKGLQKLEKAGRLIALGHTLRYVRFLDDFPVYPLANVWTDTGISGFAAQKLYVVQTMPKVVQRCILMTTDPGDLVLDPTCGSGTTPYVAEQWGRRWITIDTSRVPLALARQRLLTATFPYYQLKDEARGPASGFVYKRKQNNRGEEIGGIVPHITLKSIANGEPPQQEVLVDRPEETEENVVRVSGPFTVEATIPTPTDWNDADTDQAKAPPEEQAGYLDRMLEVLRKSPVLQVGGGKAVTLKNIRPPAKSLSLSAEALVDAPADKTMLAKAIDAAHEKNTNALPLSQDQKPVAIVFGPENGPVSQKLVFEAAREANARGHTHLYVIGFNIQADARLLVEQAEHGLGIPATWVPATPDLMMGDLLKTTRSSQIFSVAGLPEIKIHKLKPEAVGGLPRYQVELLGVDTFDPVTMQPDSRKGEDVPAWLLDTDHNATVFHVSQAFFPRTGAWENLKKALRATHDESVWDHLAGTKSAPFTAGEHDQIAVKVIDDRGNELLVTRKLSEAV